MRTGVEIVNPVDVADATAWLRTMYGVFLLDPHGPGVDHRAEVMQRIWEPARVWGARDGERWVATLRTETRTLTVPGIGGATRQLDADAVTNVTVSATHRRQGLMSGMLGAAMDAARERGDAVSILIAAEWPIYGRFGYAPAVWSADYVLHRRRAGAVHGGDLSRVRGSDREEIAAVSAGVFAEFARRRPGQVGRDRQLWNISLGQDGFPPPPADADLPQHWIVHEGEAGIDGILGWRAVASDAADAPTRARVWGFFTADDAADRDLWAYLSGIDLVDAIAVPRRPVDEPARWLLSDGRALALTDRYDFLWLRVLDVPAALSARRYCIDAEIVLEVRDDTPVGGIDVSGRYQLKTAGDTVECALTSRSADLELTQRALAAIYLGGVEPAELVPSHAVSELVPGALERARLMFSAGQLPWNATSF